MSEAAGLWPGRTWPESTVVVLASGPSLTEAQCAAVRDWRDAEAGRHVIAINTTFLRAPWADVLYACDGTWWVHYFDNVTRGRWPGFERETWTQERDAATRYGLRWIESSPSPGLGRRPGVIHQGGNSGYQAINLAVQRGARRVLLLGFDMQAALGAATHWHGEHPRPLTNTRPYLFAAWRKNFAKLAEHLKQDGIEVLNCTPGSALTCFPAAELAEALR